MPTITDDQIRSFQRRIVAFYRIHGRFLPWRKTTDPYAITVAELMLQQTQVERVIPKYEAWSKKWPTWRALSKATTRQLLTAWSGLGYNRRCLHLGKMAKIVETEYGGLLPSEQAALEKLPGVGRYTSRAILIFAHNVPLITIDTNIRRVLIYEFGLPLSITRGELEELAWRLLPKRRSRDWHNALMDYGALRVPKRTAPTGVRQGKFEGSRRQIRGEILRRLTKSKSAGLSAVAQAMGIRIESVREAAAKLEQEGVVKVIRGRVRLK